MGDLIQPNMPASLSIESSENKFPNWIMDEIGVSPTQFGAKGDGKSDDTLPLQKTIDYCITNNKILVSESDKVYGISSRLNINSPIKINFNYAAIKALNIMDSLIYYNVVNKKHSRVENLTLDCNALTSYGIYATKGQTSRFNNINILNVSSYGIYIANDYEYFFENIYIQGNGQTSTTGIRTNGDSHFSNIIMLDCYTAIYTTNPSMFSNIHAWLSSTAVIAGSRFVDGSGGGSFYQCYADTYQYAFYLTSNTNYYRISDLFFFANPTIYTSAKVSEVPTMFYFNNSAPISTVTITGSVFVPLNVSSGLTGGGIFSTRPLFEWTGKMINCQFNGISAVPDNISGTVIIDPAWTVVYNRLTRRNGRIKLELCAFYTSGNIPQNALTTLCTFSDGYYPTTNILDKGFMALLGGSTEAHTTIFARLHANWGNSNIQINVPTGTDNTLKYVYIDTEYEAQGASL